jgi:hypothetical protein
MKVRKTIIMLIFLMLNVTIALADPTLPCVGEDIDTPCELPLDTWVCVLVIAALIYGAYRMHQKQKALSA